MQPPWNERPAPARRLLLIVALGMFAVAAMISLLALFVGTDRTGQMIVCGLATVPLLLGLLALYLRGRTSPRAVAWTLDTIHTAPRSTQIRWFQAMFWCVVLGWPLITFHTIRHWQQGRFDSVGISRLIDIVAQRFGIAVGAILLALIGIVCAASAFVRVRQLSRVEH